MNQLDEPNFVAMTTENKKKSTDRTSTRYINSTTDDQEGLGLYSRGDDGEPFVNTELKPLESIETHNRLDKMRQIKNEISTIMNDIDQKQTETIDSTTFAPDRFQKKQYQEDQNNNSVFLIQDNSKDIFH